MGKLKVWFQNNKNSILAFIKKWISFFFNPRFVLCFLTGWMITNGWSYIMFVVGTFYEISWMIIVSTAYMSFLWAPLSPEKIVTLIIAVFLLKLLFPDDKKTLKVLREELDQAKAVFKRRNDKRKNREKRK